MGRRMIRETFIKKTKIREIFHALIWPPLLAFVSIACDTDVTSPALVLPDHGETSRAIPCDGLQ